MLFSVCRRAREALRRRAIEDVPATNIEAEEEKFEEPDPASWLKSICGSLRRNDSLDTLDIDAQKTSLADDDILTLYDALRNNHVLSNLLFRNIRFKMNNTLNLEPISKDANTSIKLLHIEESGKQILAMGLSLTSYDYIRTLNLKGNLIDVQSAEAIGLILQSNGSLRELRICHNRFDDEGIKFLANGLRKNRNLKILDLLENGLNDKAILELMHSICYNDSLEFLCLDFNDFGFAGVQAISSMLKKNTCLKELHLFGNRIDSHGAGRIAEGLCHNSTLHTLILSYNQIGDQGAKALAQALTVNSTITKLWCPSNQIGNEGLQSIGRALPGMKGLEELHMDDLFDDFAALDLIEGMKFNTRVTTLYIESPIFAHDWVESKLDFYLRMNKSGRSILYAPNAPLSLWAPAFAKANRNCNEKGAPDVLYTILRQKPEMFDSVIII